MKSIIFLLPEIKQRCVIHNIIIQIKEYVRKLNYDISIYPYDITLSQSHKYIGCIHRLIIIETE